MVTVAISRFVICACNGFSSSENGIIKTILRPVVNICAPEACDSKVKRISTVTNDLRWSLVDADVAYNRAYSNRQCHINDGWLTHRFISP
jgi:hypothetical protein